MSNLSIPNSVANGTAADGNELDANFDAIQAWADSHVIEKSGGTFTGNVVLAGAPTIDLQAATKAYVDTAVAAATPGAGEITTTMLAADSVTSAKIAADAVGSSEIAAGAVGTTELADDSVTAAKIAADAVGASEIAAGAVGTTELADSSVTAAKIADGVITDAEIADGAFASIQRTLHETYCGRVTRGGAYSVASGSLTTIGWDAENYDPGGMFDVAQPYYISILVSGFYHFAASVGFNTTTDSSSTRKLMIQRCNSGGTAIELIASAVSPGDASSVSVQACAGSIYLTAGELVKVDVYQDTGASRDLIIDGAVSVPQLSWHLVRYG